jgi:uncharacterized protein
MADYPVPDMTPVNEPYWRALEQGFLRFQSCDCGNRWLPPRAECPNCLRADHWTWQRAAGTGEVVSWVEYHTAYHPSFAGHLPYNVAIVALTEGPRLITNIAAPSDQIAIGMPVRLAPILRSGVALAGFEPMVGD